MLSWAAADPASGSIDPTGYRVERRRADDPVWRQLPLTVSCQGGTCTATDTAAEVDTSYRYRVTSLRGRHWESRPGPERLAASLFPTAALVAPAPVHMASIAVEPGAEDRLVAVGSTGAIAACTADCGTASATWRVLASPVGRDLHRVVVDPRTGAAWAVGSHGTVVTCAGDCATAIGTWRTVSTSLATGGRITADLYGVYAEGDVVAVVGSGGGLWYSTTGGDSWRPGTFTGPGPGARTTLHSISGPDARHLVVVGAKGFMAGCAFTGSGVCGDGAAGGHAFSPVTYAQSEAEPEGDAVVRDVVWLGPAPGTFHAVGSGGLILAAPAPSGPWVDRRVAGVHDLRSAVALDGVEVGAVGSTGDWVRCTVAACAAAAPAAPEGVIGITGRAGGSGQAGYWAVGGGAGTVWRRNAHPPVGWAATAIPRTVDPDVLRRDDGDTVRVPLHPRGEELPATCAAPYLRAVTSVPGGPVPEVAPIVRVRLSYRLTGAPPGRALRVLASTDGRTWHEPADTAVSEAGGSQRTMVARYGTDLTWDTGQPQSLGLCVMGGETGGQTMTVDLLHVDVGL